MNIDKAIEILEAFLRGDEPDYGPDLPNVIRMGIEALKRQKTIRGKKSTTLTYPLPGEDEE